MLNRRGLIASLIAGALSTAMGTAYAGEPYKIAALSFGQSGEYMKAWSNEILNHPWVKDGKVKVTILDGRYDPLVQSNQIDTAITQHYDAIIMSPFDLNASAGPIDKAHEAHIPLIVSALSTSSKNYTASIIVNDRDGGKIIGEEMGKALGGKGNVVLLEGPIGQSAQIERRAGVEEGLKENPGVKLLASKSGNWSRAEGQTIMENWLLSYKGKIDGVLSENDEMALGAIEAMKAAKVDFAETPVISIDGIPDGKRAVADGTMRETLYKYARAEGQGAVDLALHAIIGDSYKPQSEIWTSLMKWDGGKDKDYTVPWLRLTKDNVAKYMN